MLALSTQFVNSVGALVPVIEKSAPGKIPGRAYYNHVPVLNITVLTPLTLQEPDIWKMVDHKVGMTSEFVRIKSNNE